MAAREVGLEPYIVVIDYENTVKVYDLSLYTYSVCFEQ